MNTSRFIFLQKSVSFFKKKKKEKGNKHLFENQKNSYLRNTDPGRNKPKQYFHQGVKARRFYEKGKGNNYLNRRQELLLVLKKSQEKISIDANRLSYSLATHNGANSKE